MSQSVFVDRQRSHSTSAATHQSEQEWQFKRKINAALPARRSRVAGQVEIRAAGRLPPSSRERWERCGWIEAGGRESPYVRQSRVTQQRQCECVSSQRRRQRRWSTLSFSERAPIYLHFRAAWTSKRGRHVMQRRGKIFLIWKVKGRKEKKTGKKTGQFYKPNVIVMTPNDLKPVFLNHLQPKPMLGAYYG